MGEITKITPDIWRIKVPFINTSQPTNCYLAKGPDGFAVIDCGFSVKSAQTLWTKALAFLGIKPNDVKRIIVTHHHVDHFGLANWMQQFTEAPVLMSEKAYRQAQYTWESKSSYTEDILQLYRACGVPEDVLSRLMISVKQYLNLINELPRVCFLSEQDTVELGEYRYTIRETRGHAEGHLLFYSEENGVLISGDHVLDSMIPNLYFTCRFDVHPLKSYLPSLHEIDRLDVRLVLPGHGDPFRDLSGTASRIAAHYQAKLEQLLQSCKTPKTPYEIYVEQNRGIIVPSRLRYGMIELKAMINHLVDSGELVEQEEGKYRQT